MKRGAFILLLFILTIAAWGGEPAKNFTAMEINHIRVKTPGLFSGRKSISLHLDSLQGSEFCFRVGRSFLLTEDVAVTVELISRQKRMTRFGAYSMGL